jgi:hypothetical protein
LEDKFYKGHKAWLLREYVGDELLLYDLRSHRAHAVKQPAIWLLDADDGRPARALATEATVALGAPVSTSDVVAGRDALEAIDLGRGSQRRRGRRQVLAAAAAALAVSIAAPRVAEAASGCPTATHHCASTTVGMTCEHAGVCGTCSLTKPHRCM